MNSATNEYLKFGAEDRKSIYSKYITYSMLISSLILLSAAVYPIIKDLLRNNDQEQIKVEAPRVINYSQLSAPPPIDLEKPEPETFIAPPKAKQVKFIQPVAKKDEDVIEEEYIPAMNELQNVQISTIQSEGIDSIIVDQVLTIEEPVNEEIFSFVEVMPSFEGGDQELLRYLGDNLKYPKIAIDVNAERTVYLQFVVEADGNIAEVTVLRSVFEHLDQEAIRVIKAMPKWLPGRQNGKSVRVLYTIPIKFDIQ
ncbi:MAG TPA: hypothetical protein DCR48_03605 [Flavobacteriales bacterium]|nr:hypothetical protein [Flavobacteriales bacterium]